MSPRRRDRRSMLFNNLEKFHPLKHITKSGMELSKYFKFTILNIDDSGETKYVAFVHPVFCFVMGGTL
ncbi:hypothetical protein D3C87_1953110 [compost metagenome]